MKSFFLLIPFALLSFFHKQGSQKIAAHTNNGTVKISFVNTVKGKPLELNTGKYINPFGEEYSVSKFKYYVSQVSLLRVKAVFWAPHKNLS